MWFGSRSVSLSPLNLFVSKGSIYCIGDFIVLSIGIELMWCDGIVTFAQKPNAVNESCLVVSTWSLFVVKIFKGNVRLGLLMWIYALMREVFGIIGCHVGDTIGN